jgi:hypothetical protein
MKIVKIVYHALACLLLVHVAVVLARRPFVACCLIAIAAFHAYDVWWFFNQKGPAPI